GRAPLLPCQYWVPRVCLQFLAEDPQVFAERVACADSLRKRTQGLLMYHLYVDCMPTEGLDTINEKSLQRVKRLAVQTPKMKDEKSMLDQISTLEKEVKLDYKHTMNMISFDRVVASKPEMFSFVTLPDKEQKEAPEKGIVPIPDYPFRKRRREFNFLSLLTRPEAIHLFAQVQDECNKAAVLSLFNTTVTKLVSLEEFEEIQTQAFTQVQEFLKGAWIDSIKTAIKSSLEDAGKWFNLEESDWDAYQSSKLCKLMERIRFMLQDTLRYLVQNSLISFTQFVLDACQCVLDCSEDMEWGPDITNSPYVSQRNPLFVTDIELDITGVLFSPSVESVEASLISLFDNGIMATHSIPQLEQYVLENMEIPGTPMLESVGLQEPKVEELREALRSAVRKTRIPLHAYGKKYEKFLEINNNDIQYFLKGYEEQFPPTQEVTKIVETYLSEKETLDHLLPSSIIIGPFQVKIEHIRLSLSDKHKALATAMLDMLAKTLHSQVQKICEAYEAISTKMHERPTNIEELVELRDWLRGVPEQLAVQEQLIEEVMEDYKVMEDFLYNLTEEDFTDKWTASYWPVKMSMESESVRLQHADDEERFRKTQISDQKTFQEKLEEMQLTVGGFSVQSDVNQAHELAEDARDVRKQLKELQELAVLYNNRERLFGVKVTDYSGLNKMLKDFQPYFDLWTTVSNWIKWNVSWMNDSLLTIEAEELEKNVTDSVKTMQRCVKQFKDSPDCQSVAKEFRDKMDDFKQYVPLIQGLRNPGMRSRHWEMLSSQVNAEEKLDPSMTFGHCLELNLQDHMETVLKVAETASKEYAIESALNKIEAEWKSVSFSVVLYKNTNTYILKSTDDISQLLDDHIVLVQSMSFSPFKKPFEERMNLWETKLKITQDVLEEWLNCQRSWLYLEPIFSSEDIKRQLPLESQRYNLVDTDWRDIMKKANKNPEVISLCPHLDLLKKLQNCNQLLELVQKGLSEYLETKRTAFPRFYFLSDDELLEILSQTKDPTAVQPHLHKCFENIARLKFQEDLQITHMYSGEGEEVKLSSAIIPTENVEDWLVEVEKTMRASVRDNIEKSIGVYPEVGELTHTMMFDCERLCCCPRGAKLDPRSCENSCPPCCAALSFLLSRGKSFDNQVSKPAGCNLVSCCFVCQAVFIFLMPCSLTIRYYWTRGDLYIRAVNAEFIYGYEYLGNTGRLVITPLTDRCYLTLTGALHLKFGGAPAGPAGTGKTETTKDLGKALAIQTVVFNCSDQLDFMAMGKFFKGLASAGAWACFDEFNRIDIEVLSVVAQQITTIQKAQQQRVETFIFEGTEIPLMPSCAVFVTMNPGYAGRTELPDNLKALFRPVAMMVPDYSMIAEISLYSFGFNEAKVLAKKITTTFKLLSEQLSSQDHYDFGMRAVKTVISTAGNLKRENPDMDEELICLRAIRDANVPKFLQDDLKLFSGIVSDLFPNIKETPVDYGILEEAIRKSCIQANLKDVDGFVTKCIQLYETTVVRHGLMLVGPTGSGKTKSYEVLAAAMTSLKGQPAASGGNYEEVRYFVLNPKSITMGQLYGEFNLLTHEWTDGIFSTLMRRGTVAADSSKKWYMFDGPVDALWIENMNTVLDDNKKLCLSSGEIIKMTEGMTMMFEVQDLAVASPATVSRCGMVYLEPSILGLDPFIECWLKNVPEIMQRFAPQLASLFRRFLQEAIDFLRNSVKEIITSTDGNLTTSLLVLLECLYQPFIPIKGLKTIPREKMARMGELIEPWFIFALVWSVGATGDSQGREAFSSWLRKKMSKERIRLLFPEEGLVYDYKLDDAGLSSTEEEDEDQTPILQVHWEVWLEATAKFTMVPDTNFCDIIVPTMNTVRMAYLLELLLTNYKPVLCIGPTGTGKTLTIADKLLKNLPNKYIAHFLTFSARTSANQTQDLIDGKLDKRQDSFLCGVYGPPVGRYFIFFIDDLNMPMLEQFGAQPPIELLRQWMDHHGWYDRKQIGTFKKLVDINFVCAMGPPGGGRNPVTPRLTRHFNYLSFTEMDDSSKRKIFSNILGSWMDGFLGEKSYRNPVPGADAVKDLNEPLVDATISVYTTITSQLLPTPAKSHYTFNLRDLSKVFQGMLMVEPGKVENKEHLLRLWYHESCRVFRDRLVSDEDRTWFDNLMTEKMVEFGTTFEEVIPTQPVLFGDFMEPGSNVKLYQAIESQDKLRVVIEDYLEEYNQSHNPELKLVLFMDAIQHICRISRILRQAPGNALLLGVGGSGRQSLTRLASHMAENECFQIELSKNYGMTEWRDDVRKIMMKAGLESLPKTFLFVDTQIKSESFLEDINNLLNSGDIPNIYSPEEEDQIMTAMKPIVRDLGQQPTKANLMAAYVARVRSNIHLVLCMSPIGEVFRARLRQFPSLVNCCTIDWFNEWPAEALQSVASSFLNELPLLGSGNEDTTGMVR
ncbi:DYH1 protein, partial [Spizella passerina]|nr:DYH1 protein [Spizella passerina]